MRRPDHEMNAARKKAEGMMRRGKTNAQIATRLKVTRRSVLRWRNEIERRNPEDGNE